MIQLVSAEFLPCFPQRRTVRFQRCVSGEDAGGQTVIDDSPCLLITDDDRALRETLDALFQSRGYRTLLAADGAEAVEIVRADLVHVLLIDQHMPRLTGVEAIGELTRLQLPPPCILMSAQLDDAVRRAARLDPVFSVLSKPFRAAEITHAVADVMRRHYDWPPLN
jgi:two-component system chemotaxis response regulator CheY